MRRLILMLAVAALTTAAACGDGGSAPSAIPSTSVAEPSTSTTTPVPSPSTTTSPSTAAPTTPAKQRVDSGTSAAGRWQLWAERQANGLLCSALEVDGRDAGRVCNEASEQDFNGDPILRYAVPEGTFVLGVGKPSVATVRAELRGGTVVDRPTVAASFTSDGRFVVLPLPAGGAIRTLAALDTRGQVLTSFAVNP